MVFPVAWPLPPPGGILRGLPDLGIVPERFYPDGDQYRRCDEADSADRDALAFPELRREFSGHDVGQGGTSPEAKPMPTACVKRLVLVAGGTGGHICPAVAFGQWLASTVGNIEITYVSGNRPLEREIYGNAGLEAVILPCEGSPTGASGTAFF